VHDHQSEVVSEGVRDEEPLAGQVLEPDLRLSVRILEDQRKATVLNLGVDFKSAD